MFHSLSENKKEKPSIRVYYTPLNSNRVNFTFGRPEWQQKYSTTTGEFHCNKKLTDNRIILDKEYLKPNYSGFKLIHFPQKKPFLTSNARDFISFNIKPEERSKLNEERLNFLKNSKIKMGEHNPENKSIYGYLFEDPKKQTPRFNYDKIHFKYDPYNLHPITQEPIWKDPKKMNPFEEVVFKEINKFREEPQSIQQKIEILRKGLSRLRAKDPFLNEIDNFLHDLKSIKPMMKY